MLHCPTGLQRSNHKEFQHSRSLNQATLLSAVVLKSLVNNAESALALGKRKSARMHNIAFVPGFFHFFFLWLNNITLYSYECVLSHFGCAILWAIAHQAPLSMGFSRQEYWSGLPCPLPGPGIKLTSL